MNRKLLLAGIIVVAVILGMVQLAMNNDETSQNAANTTNGEANDGGLVSLESNTDNELGVDTGVLAGDYRLIVTANANGNASRTVFEVDRMGNISSMAEGNSRQGGLVFLDGITYVQNNDDGTWVSYPAGSGGAPSLSADDLGLNNEDLDEISSNSQLEQLPDEDCNGVTCRVYRDIDTETDETSIIRIDKSNNRLIEVEVTDTTNGEVTLIQYEYEQGIVITAPEGAQPLNLPGLN